MDKIKHILKVIFPIVKNKYFIASFAFIIYLTFFDSDNFVERLKSKQRLSDMERKKEFYKREIAKSERQLHELQTNKDNLEKFAREEYLMKRKNEDVFIIKD